jgi:DNA-binding beta-propeller fold protein YncE
MDKRRRRNTRSKKVLYALVAAVLAIMVVAAVAAVLITRGDEEAAARAQPIDVLPNSIAVVDPKANRVIASISVDDGPSAVAVADGKVWVLSTIAQTISLIDANSKQVLETLGVEAQATRLAAGTDRVWVGNTAKLPADGSGGLDDAARTPGSILELDAQDGTVVRTIDAAALPPPPASVSDIGPVAFEADSVWFLSGNQTVSRIDAASGTVVASMRYEGLVSGIEQPSVTAGEGGVWVSASGGTPGGVVTRIDPRTNARVATVEVPAAGAVVAGMGSVWVADRWYPSESVWQIDPDSNRPVGSTQVGPLPLGIAVGENAVWATSSDGFVSRIDPASGKVVARIRVGGTPSGIAVGEGAVWVTVG